MDDNVREFVTSLGERILERDWTAAHAMLAPWLRGRMTPDDVRAFFEDEYKSALEACGIDELHYPAHPEPQVGGNSHTNATALRDRRWCRGAHLGVSSPFDSARLLAERGGATCLGAVSPLSRRHRAGGNRQTVGDERCSQGSLRPDLVLVGGLFDHRDQREEDVARAAAHREEEAHDGSDER